MIPTDKRTNAYRLYDKALSVGVASLASLGAGYLGFGSRGFGYRDMAYPRAVSRRKRSSFLRPFKRRYGRRFYKKKWSRGKKRSSRRFIAGKGPFQKKYRSRLYKALNTNLSRNDYDSTREVYTQGTITGSTSAAVGANVQFNVGELDLAATKIAKYDEIKHTNIQLVISPTKFFKNASTVASLQAEPYLYVIPRIHGNDDLTLPSFETVIRTPGVMKYRMDRQKKIVVNLPCQAPIVDTWETGPGTGTTDTLNREMRYIGWYHNPWDGTGTLPLASFPYLGNAYVYMPQLESGSAIPQFRLELYVTTLMKNNRDLLLV